MISWLLLAGALVVIVVHDYFYNLTKNSLITLSTPSITNVGETWMILLRLMKMPTKNLLESNGEICKNVDNWVWLQRNKVLTIWEDTCDIWKCLTVGESTSPCWHVSRPEGQNICQATPHRVNLTPSHISKNFIRVKNGTHLINSKSNLLIFCNRIYMC